MAAALVVVGFVFFHMEIIADGFWYLAVGRHLLETGELYAPYPFSYTAVRQPWIIHHVGTVFLFAELERHVGLLAVIYVSALAQAAAYLVLWIPHAKTGLARVATFFWTLFAIQLASPDISARGASFSDLCFACLLLCLWLLKDGRGVHWAVPLALGAAWANAHSSFPLAVMTPLFVGLSLWLFEPPGDRPALVPFARFAGLALLGGGLTPYSWLLTWDVMVEVRRPETWNIDLFRTPELHQPLWIATIAFTLVLCWARGRYGATRHGRTDIALLLCFLLATCLGRRYGSQLTAVATVLVARTANELGPIPIAPRLRTALFGLATAVQLCVAAWFARTPKDPFFHGPFAAAAFIEQHKLPEHVWAKYDWGSFLLYAWRGHRKVFIDGASHVYGNGVFDDDLAILTAAPETGELLDAYDLNTLLCPRGSPIHQAAASSERWRPVYGDERAVVFVRR